MFKVGTFCLRMSECCLAVLCVTKTYVIIIYISSTKDKDDEHRLHTKIEKNIKYNTCLHLEKPRHALTY